ncbi:protein-glutamate O-methyltransferase CheR [Pseudomonas aeruginosa]|nr:protein-glutamate O-methyltransferase CheR [Pseudomonas aeruginosa]
MNDRFERLLKSRIGLDASSVGSAVIERAVRQRMSGLALHDEDEYWMRLNGSPGEVQALIEAVVVPETWFFRYPESFTTLARLAFERLPSLGGGRALRILSLPCSTGEEPYSIVMALLDAGLSEYLFEVDALDVSARVIERASLGVYGRNSFRGDELGFRDRHFSEVADGYQLAEQVRRKVRFRCGNLLDPGLLAGEAPYDFVFRRTSEAPRGARPKAVSDGARPVVAAAVERASIRPSPPPPAKPRQRLSSLVPPASGQPLATPVGEFDEIARLADAGQHREARAACERQLAARGPSATVFYWLGLLSDVAGQEQEAQDFYRKALYLEPQHAEALAHLAALLAARGDHAGARRLQQRAARGVNKDG